ncbi:MAG: bifunctional demethylmenaquinone methyltransferase/2-methoxy-6-polyprenyl-1,4-benzoquinol methylase UbiE [Candidatus Latescibacterota bacterium]|nr:bifunctional demethylmenaquinone methyltransferase/2-methoxy-6-polyprenyl-1,4-benzoquinol methylase UbiE [Candidatus Latescibacterota bacterium]
MVIITVMDEPVYMSPSAKRKFVRGMFDGIAGTYDLLNHLLSAGIDIAWRRKAVDLLDPQADWRVLDLATGTGDLGFEVAGRNQTIAVTGADVSVGMLRRGYTKAKSRAERLAFLAGDAEGLPFVDALFDGVAIGFGIRNVADLDRGLAEIHRVLKPGGRVAILEFSKPTTPILKGLYFLYFKRVLPLIGKMISRDPKAYTYLYESVMWFPEGDVFCQHLLDAGLTSVEHVRLTFGIASIYIGLKG